MTRQELPVPKPKYDIDYDLPDIILLNLYFPEPLRCVMMSHPVNSQNQQETCVTKTTGRLTKRLGNFVLQNRNHRCPQTIDKIKAGRLCLQE